MKFSIKNKTNENPANILRRVGYRYFGLGKKETELVFYRPLGQDAFPRFHLYLEEDKKNDQLFFSIHLDQRRPVYSGSVAHHGEYQGELVEKEVEKVKKAFAI